MSSFADLVHQSRASAGDPGWLGSVAHLKLLTDAVRGLGADDVDVSWAPPSGRTYWEAASRRIVVERPLSGEVPVPNEDLAEFTAIGVLHEVLHIRFSSPSTREQQVAGKDPWVQAQSEVMFNYLEDAPVAELAVADDPDLAGPIATLLDASVDSLPVITGFTGPGTSPTNPRAQLPFAIMAYALRPDRAIELHHAVAAELDRLKPIVDRARIAGETDGCVGPAIALIEQVVHFQP
jgi:hypothetical protein